MACMFSGLTHCQILPKYGSESADQVLGVVCARRGITGGRLPYDCDVYQTLGSFLWTNQVLFSVGERCVTCFSSREPLKLSWTNQRAF